MKRTTLALIALLIAAGALTLALIGISQQTTMETGMAVLEPVRIGYKPHIGHLLLFVASDNGYFAEQGLTVEPVKFETTDIMLRALVAGDIDAITGVNTVDILAIESAAPGTLKIVEVLVATETRYFEEIMVPVGSSLQSFADLRGKRIGLPPGPSYLLYFDLILQNNNMSRQEVTIQQMDQKLLLQALSAGSVDAILAIEPLGIVSK